MEHHTPAGTHTNSAGSNVPLVVYILYLVSFALGITFLIGVVVAYVYRGSEHPEWQQAHYRFLIRTFWISVLYTCIAAVLCVIAIGYLLLVLTMVWLIIRCVRGIKAFSEKSAPSNVTAWLY